MTAPIRITPEIAMLRLSHDERVAWLMKSTARLKEMASSCDIPEDSAWFLNNQRCLDLMALGFYDV